MSVISPSVTIAIQSPSPNDGDVEFFLSAPIEGNAGIVQPTDAELIDIANRLLASDYIQNQPWGGTAALWYINIPEIRQVYP